MIKLEPDEKREDLRIDLKIPILCEVRILNPEIKEEKTLPAEILDLGAGGMKIRSPLKLPVQDEKDITFEFSFYFEQKNFTLTGKLYWRKWRRIAVKPFDYGVKFIDFTSQNEPQKESYQVYWQCLNQYQLRLEKQRRQTYPGKKPLPGRFLL